MTNPTRTPQEEARRVAHAIVCERQDSEWCHWSSNKDAHAHYCDTLTAALAPYLTRALAPVPTAEAR